MKHGRRIICTALVAAALPHGVRAQSGGAGAAGGGSTEVAGVRFPNTVSLGGQTLGLNGAGIRYRAVFKVYALGLYVAQKSTSPEVLLNMATPKRFQMVMLRTVDAREFGKILSAGIENNASREEFVATIPAFQHMGEVAAEVKALQPGEVLTIDWVPSVGMTLTIKGQTTIGPYKDPRTMTAMSKIWLGRKPPDAQLKDALLGLAKAPAASDMN